MLFRTCEMSDFPILKTGAVLQYPAEKETSFATQVVRFVDGSEQRFRSYQSPIHRWTIQLELLDQSELQSLGTFFRTQAGAAESFAFTDPWDGTKYTNCTLESSEAVLQLFDEVNGKTSLIVRENRS